MSYNAIDLARYIISKCSKEHCSISNLQLQKILYYIQVEWLSKNNEPLFNNDICAWQFGPVVPDVYYLYNGYGASKILSQYDKNMIDIEGHTDNVPIHNQKYEDNDVLSMYRALTVADYIREKTDLNPGLIKSSGRGDYVPVADNSTPEGRAINRRVEVKIYNSYNSPAQGE